jgi:lipopolysaccharide biosynthesis glycosyltransferase
LGQAMNIVVSANKEYLEPLKVLLFSLAKLHPATKIDVYFLQVSLNKKDLSHLGDFVAQRCNGCFHELSINSERLGLLANFKTESNKKMPLECYTRVFIPYLLPPTLERALWLDVDIMPLGSIKEFYNQPFDGKSIVAVKGHCPPPGRAPVIGHFNAGVLLFNLEKMRSKISFDNLQEYIKRDKTKTYTYGEEDLLNVIFQNDKKLCDEKYNYQVLPYRGFDLKDLNGKILLHTLGLPKSWEPGGRPAFRQLYQNTLDRIEGTA